MKTKAFILVCILGMCLIPATGFARHHGHRYDNGLNGDFGKVVAWTSFGFSVAEGLLNLARPTVVVQQPAVQSVPVYSGYQQTQTVTNYINPVVPVTVPAPTPVYCPPAVPVYNPPPRYFNGRRHYPHHRGHGGRHGGGHHRR
jgi:hypothetical protein